MSFRRSSPRTSDTTERVAGGVTKGKGSGTAGVPFGPGGCCARKKRIPTGATDPMAAIRSRFLREKVFTTLIYQSAPSVLSEKYIE